MILNQKQNRVWVFVCFLKRDKILSVKFFSFNQQQQTLLLMIMLVVVVVVVHNKRESKSSMSNMATMGTIVDRSG